jgi:uncharacterized membrane protein
MTPTYNQIAARDLGRLAALSDGLFAIAMTLIVLEIRVPDVGPIQTDRQLLDALGELGPRFVTYLLSFLTLGIFWVGQQTQLNHLTRGDRNLTWIFLAFLAAVALMPFSTSLLAEFIELRVALVAYWANIFILGLILYASWTYAGRAGLYNDNVTDDISAAMRRRIRVAQALYFVGMLLCVVSTSLSIAFIVVVQLNYAIAPRIPGLSRL